MKNFFNELLNAFNEGDAEKKLGIISNLSTILGASLISVFAFLLSPNIIFSLVMSGIVAVMSVWLLFVLKKWVKPELNKLMGKNFGGFLYFSILFTGFGCLLYFLSLIVSLIKASF